MPKYTMYESGFSFANLTFASNSQIFIKHILLIESMDFRAKVRVANKSPLSGTRFETFEAPHVSDMEGCRPASAPKYYTSTWRVILAWVALMGGRTFCVLGNSLDHQPSTLIFFLSALIVTIRELCLAWRGTRCRKGSYPIQFH